MAAAPAAGPACRRCDAAPRLLDRPADRMNMDIAGKAENEDGHRTSTPCFEYGSVRASSPTGAISRRGEGKSRVAVVRGAARACARIGTRCDRDATDRAARNHVAGNVVDLVDGERPRELAGEDSRNCRLEAVGVVLGNFAVVDHECYGSAEAPSAFHVARRALYRASRGILV